MNMESLSSVGGGAGALQITMLKKQMDMAQEHMATLLQAMPHVPTVTPSRVDVYA